MSDAPRRITLDEWDARYEQLRRDGLEEPSYGGPLRRHVDDGDTRLLKLRMDDSPAALRLWNFLLGEEDRLREARARGHKLLGAMKDLGTVPVMAYAFPNVTAFYPDGAWWIPCIMEQSDCLLEIADSLGVDDSFCPVRAVLGAFVTKNHFPIPDLLVSSIGAVCDDMSAIVQRLEQMGERVAWWEIPHRRPPEPGEETITLPGGFTCPRSQVTFVEGQLALVRKALEELSGTRLSDDDLSEGIARANRVRAALDQLRATVYAAPTAPLPSLEMLIAEMLAIHFCSDQNESLIVLEALRAEAARRVAEGVGPIDDDATGVFWVNPVADLRAMNMLEDVGGRLCGTEFLFSHALDPLPEDVPPMEALARAALADPMVGSPVDRADRVCRDVDRFGAEALVVSRIPGASHCALEGTIIGRIVQERCAIPVVEIEVDSITDSMAPTIQTRLEALIETARSGRTP